MTSLSADSFQGVPFGFVLPSALHSGYPMKSKCHTFKGADYTKYSRSCLAKENEIFLIFRTKTSNFGTWMFRKARTEPGRRMRAVAFDAEPPPEYLENPFDAAAQESILCNPLPQPAASFTHASSTPRHAELKIPNPSISPHNTPIHNPTPLPPAESYWQWYWPESQSDIPSLLLSSPIRPVSRRKGCSHFPLQRPAVRFQALR